MEMAHTYLYCVQIVRILEVNKRCLGEGGRWGGVGGPGGNGSEHTCKNFFNSEAEMENWPKSVNSNSLSILSFVTD